MSRYLRSAILASMAAICFALPMSASALQFNAISQVYFFGDSLTDSGFNNFANAIVNPSKAPTFTTYGGYTWAQYVARDVKGFTLPTLFPAPIAGPDTITNNTTPTNGSSGGAVDPVLTGVDFACGGSTTNSTGFGVPWAPSLVQQVTQFLSTQPSTLDPNAVYFIWSGANDVFTTLAQVPAPTELQLLTTVNTAAINIASQVSRLAARGAKRFVVISLPSLGSTPFALQLAQADPTIPGVLKNLSFTFDSMLNTQLGRIIQTQHVKVLYIDVYTLLQSVIATTQAGKPYVINGNSFTFVNYDTPACGSAPGAALSCPSSAPTNYIFADNVHPSGMAHRIISLYVENKILSWA